MDDEYRERPSRMRIWSPGEWEGDLLGFLHVEERDACEEGHPGPFTRIVRPESWGPRSLECQTIDEMFPIVRPETRRLN